MSRVEAASRSSSAVGRPTSRWRLARKAPKRRVETRFSSSALGLVARWLTRVLLPETSWMLICASETGSCRRGEDGGPRVVVPVAVAIGVRRH